MINLLLCGNEKVFDGALSELISITNKTKETINCYIFTADLTRIKPQYEAIKDKQISFLEEVIKTKNISNRVQKVDVTEYYEKELGHSINEQTSYTPYAMLRLLVDLVPNMPDKILYLDIDMMVAKDISQLYNIDITEYEYAAAKEFMGKFFVKWDYINSGMLLLNLKKIKETKLFEKSRELVRTKKMVCVDQDAIYRTTTSKLILPRIYNEQIRFNKKDTVVCHFCKRLIYYPYPRIVNYKQWQVEKVHKVLRCHAFDKDLEEYVKWKNKYNNISNMEGKNDKHTV